MAIPKVDIVSWFKRANALPMGTRALDRVLWRVVPFNKSLKPHVLNITPDEVRVELGLSTAAMNHLRSMHAAALVTVGEYSQGLLILANAGNLGAEVILKDLQIEYTAKGRGTVVASAAMTEETRQTIRDGLGRNENPQVVLTSTVSDVRTGETVATLRGTWKARRPKG